ncbi:MAG TPA: hypothetical protein VLX59_03330 [Acidimicrobiales bacterium]|nr:hypothetical protein [Acidimicrobiales bacterium]
MKWIQKRYGAHPVHLLLMLACLAIAAYALTRIRDQGELAVTVVIFTAALVLHDFVGWPIYTWLDRLAQRISPRQPDRRRREVPWINHLRAPAFISGVLLIIAFPLIAQLKHSYYAAVSGVSESAYLTHWLLVTALLFIVSAAIYLVRVAAARRDRS